MEMTEGLNIVQLKSPLPQTSMRSLSQRSELEVNGTLWLSHTPCPYEAAGILKRDEN